MSSIVPTSVQIVPIVLDKATRVSTGLAWVACSVGIQALVLVFLHLG